MTRLTIVAGALAAAFAALPVEKADAARIDVCTRIYQPVCAIKRSGRIDTFGNACEARAARARILYSGRCRAACPRIYRPVCAKVRGAPRATFPNACVARAAGARVVYGGRCWR